MCITIRECGMIVLTNSLASSINLSTLLICNCFSPKPEYKKETISVFKHQATGQIEIDIIGLIRIVF